MSLKDSGNTVNLPLNGTDYALYINNVLVKLEKTFCSLSYLLIAINFMYNSMYRVSY